MFMNTKTTGYGEDTGWKARYRLSTLNFGLHKRSLNTNTGQYMSKWWILLWTVPSSRATPTRFWMYFHRYWSLLYTMHCTLITMYSLHYTDHKTLLCALRYMYSTVLTSRSAHVHSTSTHTLLAALCTSMYEYIKSILLCSLRSTLYNTNHCTLFIPVNSTFFHLRV
jgi:hypothetical protein